MTTNVFDDGSADFLVLVNAEGQRSLWPASVDTPTGWSAEFGPAERQACLDEITRTWTDMRPAGLTAADGREV